MCEVHIAGNGKMAAAAHSSSPFTKETTAWHSTAPGFKSRREFVNSTGIGICWLIMQLLLTSS